MAHSVLGQVPASVRGIVGGIVALSVFDLFVSSDRGTAAFGWVSTAPASWFAAWLDPTKPLINDQRTSSTTSSPPSGSSPGPQNCTGLVGPLKTACEEYEGSSYTAPAPTTTLPTPSSPLYV